MRKVLIFSLVYFPKYVGGAEVAVKEITDRISSSDFQYDMIALNGGGESIKEKVGNITVYRLFSKVGIIQKLLYPFAACRKAFELHRANHYDMIWSIMASYAGFAAFLFKRKYPHVPNILTIQEGDHFERRAGIFNFAFRWIFKAADYIQVISNFLADWSEKMGARCPIVVVPNAVDVKLFSNKGDVMHVEELKRKLNKKGGDIFLITTSRLTEKNGVGDIIESLQYLAPNIKLLILGKGELEKTLKEKTAKLLLEHRVNFLGYVSHAEMPSYLHASDIFIRPSLTEGLGNSFLEAMAAGIPVIATPVGGIPDFLTDGETGLFCEVNNPKSIAQKAEKLIKDYESREYIVKRAESMVKERYEWSTITMAMKKIFESASTV
ncbi:MAG: glycosyltransferase family 4 protein [Patescibacteria group bacterium]